MAGFSYSENTIKTNSTIYHVPRTLIDLPWTDDEVTQFIFPKIQIWRSQYQSPEGESSEAARNFLFGVLPFLAKVVVQDGIYWIHDYPGHELSRIIFQVMPANYERWSMLMRNKIIEDERNNREVLTSSLNEGAKAALLSVKDTIQNEMQQLQSNIVILKDKLDHIETKLAGNDERRNNVQQDPAILPPPTTTQALPASPILLPTPVVVPLPLAHSHRPPAPRLISEVLRNTPKVPVFPSSLPKTMEEMMEEYDQFELSRWETAKMTGWPANVKQAYSRRKYTSNAMKGRAMILYHGTFEQRMKRTVQNMDLERNCLGMSVFSYINYLKKNDPSVKTRKRKEKA